MNKKYVQYGCGLSAPKEWINFDVSPTLRIQNTPIIGTILKSSLSTSFPKNIRYGDIIKGLPINENSCDGLYCSHTLEHLSLNDFRIALKNSFKILKKGGVFRCIVPDIEHLARTYISQLENGNSSASTSFINDTLMGIKERPRGFKSFIKSFYGNSHHLWMWDNKSLTEELKNAGFTQIRQCKFNDSDDMMFKLVMY
jgi:ubiquinone/menaquinone biosynthesis C-methylase UbiE